MKMPDKKLLVSVMTVKFDNSWGFLVSEVSGENGYIVSTIRKDDKGVLRFDATWLDESGGYFQSIDACQKHIAKLMKQTWGDEFPSDELTLQWVKESSLFANGDK